MSAIKGEGLSKEKALLDRQDFTLGEYATGARERVQTLKKMQFGTRLWQKDPGLWKEDPKDRAVIANALGWLDVAQKMQAKENDIQGFVAQVGEAGIRQIVHMGMGGSSLAPLAFERILARGARGLPLKVLDTTDPATLLRLDKSIPVAETLFIVASKSGTTAEPSAFEEYFFARVKALKGDRAGENFAAITDPGSALEKQARARSYRGIFPGHVDIGGRYSALSPFGIVPAALMGLNIPDLLGRALRMQKACGPDVPVEENPGIVLGAVLGELVGRGRDKLTFLIPEALGSLGLWLEQLLAESTGKEGKGILPIAEEPVGKADSYGKDRIFAKIGVRGESDREIEGLVKDLLRRGDPVIAIEMGDRLDLVQEFYRWEVATAALGAVLGINPFDQPNVQESKDVTNRFLARVRKEGGLPEPPWILREDPLGFYGTEKGKNGAGLLKAFFDRAKPGDYVALQGYLPETPAISEGLKAIRRRIRDHFRLATTLGFGPRFLHSTGQYHKGGPNRGLFLQLTAADSADAPIPNAPFSFGVLKQAQARGDFETLQKHGRRILGVHLGKDPLAGLKALYGTLEESLSAS
jgi:glucose-6-phosphate isomerase